MTETDVFPIRSYGWQELALLYNPGVQPGSATRQLRRWVERNLVLKEELTRLGWQPRIRLLTPVQVRTLVSHLGEP